MNTYRSLSVIKAVQYTGSPIEDVTCGGTEKDYREKGCDNSRRHLPHVHTAEVGGLTALRPGDWIYPIFGGPFGVVSDEKFRGGYEVPAEPVVPADEPVITFMVNTEVPSFSASSLPPAKPEEIVSDLAAIDELLAAAGNGEEAPKKRSKKDTPAT